MTRSRAICFLLAWFFLAACAPVSAPTPLEVTRVVERTVIVEVTRVVEVTRLATSTQGAAASGDLPNADTIRVDLTRRMIYEVNGGDIWWIGQVEEIKGLTVLDHAQDGSVLQVEVELQLVDSQNDPWLALPG